MKLKTIIVISLILVINLIFLNINTVKASSISDVISGGDNFVSAAKSSDDDTDKSSIDQSKLQEASNTIYNILLFCGMALAIIITGILGIKFMIGSVEEKAQVKDALVPFVIGCIVIFGAFGIWKIFVTFGNNL